MNLSLNFVDRLSILNILPNEGNFKTLVIIQDIKKKIEISQEEIKDSEIEVVGGLMKWNKEKANDKEVVFTDLESNEIKLSLEKLNKENKLTFEMLNICKIFDVK